MHTELTKCTGAGCPLKASCVRLEIPRRGDTYLIAPWYRTPSGEANCDFYLTQEKLTETLKSKNDPDINIEKS